MKSIGLLGAGIGNLVAGAYLIKHGFHVTILEKATTVGGSAGYYSRNGRTFPTGATIAFGFENEGLMRNLLKELLVEVPFRVLDHPMNIVLSDRTISVYKDREKWEEELKRVFPENKNNVLSFWRNLEKISNDVFNFTKTNISFPLRVYHFKDLVSYCFHQPSSLARLGRYSYWTVGDLLVKHGLKNYTIFHEFLNAQLVDAAQTTLDNAALLPSALALDIYRRGSYYMEGGFTTLVKQLENRVTCSARIEKATEIKKVTFDKENRKWNVETKKGLFTFDILVNGTGIDFFKENQVGEKKQGCWGAIRMDAILSKDILNDSEVSLPFAYQVIPSSENASLFGDEHGPVYITLHPSFDSNGELIPSEILLTASVHSPIDEWLSLNKDEYLLKKELVKKAMIEEIETVIPSFNDYLVFAFIGTPKTYQKFIGKAHVGGVPMTVSNSILSPKGSKGAQPSYYLVGETVFPGPGTLSSALSGFYAARAIVHENRDSFEAD